MHTSKIETMHGLHMYISLIHCSTIITCKYKKIDTDSFLYRVYYSELLESFTDYTHIFGDKEKTAAAFYLSIF